MVDPAVIAARRALGVQLAATRGVANLTQAQLARQVNYQRSSIGNVERGRQNVPREFWVRCDELLGSAGALTQAYDKITHLIREQRGYAMRAAQAVDTFRLDRLSASSISEPARHPEFSSSYGLAPKLAAGDVGPDVTDLAIEQIHEIVRALSARYLTDSPADVYAQTSAMAEAVFARVHDPHPKRSHDLYLAAGYLYTLLGWMAGDLGQHAAAAAHNRTGWLCAELTDHHPLRSWALSTMSKAALWSGDHATATRLATRGMGYPVSGTVKVMLACQQADGCADAGDATAAHQALTVAEAAAEHAGFDEIGGLLSCSDIRRQNYAASVLLRTGDPVAAIRVAMDALDVAERTRTAYGTIAQIRICAASGHLAIGDYHTAAEILEPVFATPTHLRLAPVIQRLRDVGSFLGEQAHLESQQPIRGLSEAITDFCTPASHIALPR